jgi:hypothetical protein
LRVRRFGPSVEARSPGTWRPQTLDNTFGPRAAFQKGCSGAQRDDLAPCFGLQFFGHVEIDGASEVMTVTLKDVADHDLWSTEIEPRCRPSSRVNIHLRLADFAFPKLARIDVAGEAPPVPQHKLVFKLNIARPQANIKAIEHSADPLANAPTIGSDGGGDDRA